VSARREGPCAVPGCGRPRSGRLCGTHAIRLRRTGDVGADVPVRGYEQRQGRECIVEECAKPQRHGGQGYCDRHYIRLWRHGDVHTLVQPNGSWPPEGLGDDVSYGGLHRRIVRARGAAALHKCNNCPAPAAHWAYNHQGVDEKVDADGQVYTLDEGCYLPLCMKCHHALDVEYGRRRGRSS
jgi:hypothetical protein